jgi:hypothetical protein
VRPRVPAVNSARTTSTCVPATRAHVRINPGHGDRLGGPDRVDGLRPVVRKQLHHQPGEVPRIYDLNGLIQRPGNAIHPPSAGRRTRPRPNNVTSAPACAS